MTGTDADAQALLLRIHAATLAGVAALPTLERIDADPFTLVVDPKRRDHHFSYAVPNAWSVPTRGDVDGLLATFRRRHRIPRIEMIPAIAPEAEAPLREAGWVVERRGAVMAAHRSAGLAAVGELELEEIDAGADVAKIRAFDRIQRAAFEDPPGDVDIDAFRERATHGTAVLAWLERQAVGVGVVTDASEGCAQLMGIGVLSGVRGRGIGAAITAWLCSRALDRGAELLHLSADDERAERVYGRAGFKTVGEFLHLRHREAHD